MLHMIASQDPQTVPGRSVLSAYGHGIPVFSSLNLAKLKCIHQNSSSVRIVSCFKHPSVGKHLDPQNLNTPSSILISSVRNKGKLLKGKFIHIFEIKVTDKNWSWVSAIMVETHILIGASASVFVCHFDFKYMYKFTFEKFPFISYWAYQYAWRCI